MAEMTDVANAEFTFAGHEHRELCAGIDQLHLAATIFGLATPAERTASIRRVRNWISAVLVPHAAWENAEVYPHIDARTGTEWSTKLMRFEHLQIESAAAQLDADIELLRDSMSRERVAEVGGHLFALEALIRSHIEREELFLLPLLAN